MKKKIRCAVVGVGYLGKFHADKYAILPNAELVAVCDSDSSRAEEIAAKYNTKSFSSYQEMLSKVEIDAVSISTPAFSHYEVAKFFLTNDVHVLIEKPITTKVDEADELLAIAKKRKLVLQVGHLERFNSVYIALKSMVKRPLFIRSERSAPFKLRGTDVSVILDSMIHDIDLVQNLALSPIKHIDAYGSSVLSDQIDIVNARLEFENGCIADLSASRISMKTRRKLRVFEKDQLIKCDFSDKTLTICHKGVGKIKPHIPEMLSETKTCDTTDALYTEINAFLDAVRDKNTTETMAKDARDALDTALKITASVIKNGEKWKS